MSFKLRGHVAYNTEFEFEAFDETEFVTDVEVPQSKARVSYNRVFDPEYFDERYFVTDVNMPSLKGSVVE